ncbi:MAG: S8 family serine peptidase [Candidatus Eisenbacteria bacterium]|nr:S8 family serine peptidase [Candidatus Eisenbacteria bacterium]
MTLLIASTGLARAAPNADGMLILHSNPTTVYSLGTGTYCGSSGLASCPEANTEAADPTQPTVFHALAAFPDESEPRLQGITFGVNYSEADFTLLELETCADFEVRTSDWPAPGSGTALSWNSARITHLTEVYWFVGYANSDSIATVFSLQAHPTQGAQFADDSTPPALDAIEGFGSLGFGSPGFNPGCAGPSWTEGNGMMGGEEFPEDGPVGIADPELKAIRRDVHGDTLNFQSEQGTFHGFVYFKTHRHQVGPHDPNNPLLPASTFLDPDLAALVSGLLSGTEHTYLRRVHPRFTEADTTMIAADGRRIGLPDLTRNFVIKYASETLSDQQVAALIRAEPAILWAETAFGIFEDAVPNDPKFVAGEQQHLDRIGLGLSDGDNWSRLQGPVPTWRIAVLDNGVRASHGDLGGAFGPGRKVRSAFNYLDGQENAGDGCPRDRDHGTACTGIVAALTNNQAGLAAPAGGWSGETLGPEIVSLAINCEVESVRHFRAQAIVDATGAVLPGPSHQPAACGIVSMSNGNDSWFETEREACLVGYLRDAVLVATKGNHDEERRRFPADYDSHWIVSVGASRRAEDVRATKANVGAVWTF